MGYFVPRCICWLYYFYCSVSLSDVEEKIPPSDHHNTRLNYLPAFNCSVPCLDICFLFSDREFINTSVCVYVSYFYHNSRLDDCSLGFPNQKSKKNQIGGQPLYELQKPTPANTKEKSSFTVDNISRCKVLRSFLYFDFRFFNGITT